MRPLAVEKHTSSRFLRFFVRSVPFFRWLMLTPMHNAADHDVPDECIISVTYCEQKLSKLSVHKAMGPDNIPNWILKDFSYILASPIAAIYNSSVRQSYVPPSWKQAEILPIPKDQQGTSLAKHLRPIALTPVLSKVLE